MKLQRPKADKELVNITPLIDVVFILLVFFMLAGTIEPKDPFTVAPATSASDIRGDIQDFVILIDSNGRIALDEQEVTREDLAMVVRNALLTNPGALIQIKPDAEVDAIIVIEVLEEIRNAGAEYVVLLTVGRGTEEVGL